MKASLLPAPAVAIATVQAVPVTAAAGGQVLDGAEVVEGRIMRSVTATKDRTYNDCFWAVLFAVGLAASFAGGVAQLEATSDLADAILNCQPGPHAAVPPGEAGLSAAAGPAPAPVGYYASQAPVGFGDLFAVVGTSIAVVVVLAGLVSVVYIHLLGKFSRTITWSAVCLMPVLMLCSGIAILVMPSSGDPADYAFGNKSVQGGLVCAGSAIVALIIYVRRAQVELTAELLRLAVTAFKANTGLVFSGGGTAIASMLFIVPLSVLSFTAAVPYQTAYVLAAEHNTTAAAPPPADTNRPFCDDLEAAHGGPSGWFPLFAFMGVWVQILAMEIRVANGGCSSFPFPAFRCVSTVPGARFSLPAASADEAVAIAVGGAIGMWYFETVEVTQRSLTSLKWVLELGGYTSSLASPIATC